MSSSAVDVFTVALPSVLKQCEAAVPGFFTALKAE